jgi:hypothetical protein
VRLATTRNIATPAGLEWLPASEAGATIFAALSHLRETAVGRAFAQAQDDQVRTAALAHAQSAPSVESAIATRFGDPGRWQGYEPLDATRRFRANHR